MQKITYDDAINHVKLHDKAEMVLQVQRDMIIRWMFILRCSLLYRKSNSTEELLSFLSVLTKFILKDQTIEDKNLYKDKFFFTQFSKCMAEGITAISDERIKNNLVLFSQKFGDMKAKSSLEILKNLANLLHKIDKHFFDNEHCTFKQIKQLDELSKTYFDFITQPSNRELEQFYLPSKAKSNGNFLLKRRDTKEWQSIISELELYDKIKLEKSLVRSTSINEMRKFFNYYSRKFFLITIGCYVQYRLACELQRPEYELKATTINYIWLLLLITGILIFLKSTSIAGFLFTLHWINNLSQWHKNVIKKSRAEIDTILNDLFTINFAEIDEINPVENIQVKKFILKIEDKTNFFPEENSNEDDSNQALPPQIKKLPKILKRKHQRFSSKIYDIFQDSQPPINLNKSISKMKLADIPQAQSNKRYQLTFAKKRFFADMIEKNGHLELDEDSTNKIRKINAPNNPNLLSSFMEKTLLKQEEYSFIQSLKEAYGSTHKDTNLNVIGEKGKQGIKHLFGDKFGLVKWNAEEITQENYKYEYKSFKKSVSGKRILFFSTEVDKQAISELPIGLQQSGQAFKLLLPCLILDKKQIKEKEMPAITLNPSDYCDMNAITI